MPLNRPTGLTTSRRTLLAAFGTLGVFAPLGLAAAPARGASAEPYDVLVVGSGTAGLSAAVSAREAGARRVAILEKSALAGGHGIFSSGSVAAAYVDPAAPDPEADIRAMVEEMRAVGGAGVKPALALKLARESALAIEWLRGMGVAWHDTRFRAVGAVSARCVSTGSPQAGYDYVLALLERAHALGVELHHCTRALRILTTTRRTTGEEHVVGVAADTPSGERAFPARSIVLATGGFTANVALRMKYRPRLDASYPTTVTPRGDLVDGARGEGILMAESLGASLVDMEHIQVIPYSGGRLLDFVGGEIWVNDRGERFVSEGSAFGQLSRAIEETSGRRFWAISDASTRKTASLGLKLAEGIVREAPTIEALAIATGMPLEQLSRTIERWNADVRKGRDSTFNLPLTGIAIEHPPFFYGRETWSVHYTCGGIEIDERARVLTRSGRAIPGLFAAGETTGGIHGHDRLGGNSMTDTFVFGRTAGIEAAKLAAMPAE